MDGEQTGTVETIVERSAGGSGPLSVRDAANSLLDTRRKDNAKDGAEVSRETSGDDGEQESTAQAEDAGSETIPGETQEHDPAQEPSIEPPRSWTKEDKELFKGLPRETQERLAERERSRESDFLKRQNDAAEKLKGLTAKEQSVEQARTQYEAALPLLLKSLQDQQAGEFSDIQSMADVERMSREDWPRYIQWDAHQKRMAAVAQEVKASTDRQSAEKQQKWHDFASEQDKLLLEKAPDLADKAKAAKMAEAGIGMLKDIGFQESEIGELWNGKKELSFRDHRVQLLLRDGVRYREAQAAARKANVKPVPNVQRPGPARAPTADADERVKALDSKLNQSGNLRDAARLLAAQRAARR